MSRETLALRIAEQTLMLYPDRAVLWVERSTLIVADTHFGKSALLGRHGMAVPAGIDAYDRERLGRLVERTRAARLLILGDFLHAPLDRESDDARALDGWCAALGIAIEVIAGNHDRGARERWVPAVRWNDGYLEEGPFRFRHDADAATASPLAPFTLSGHVHPVIRLAGLRKRPARVPIFWQRSNGLVLPAFGAFTGGFAVSPGPGDRIYAVGSQSVVAFPP